MNPFYLTTMKYCNAALDLIPTVKDYNQMVESIYGLLYQYELENEVITEISLFYKLGAFYEIHKFENKIFQVLDHAFYVPGLKQWTFDPKYCEKDVKFHDAAIGLFEGIETKSWDKNIRFHGFMVELNFKVQGLPENYNILERLKNLDKIKFLLPVQNLIEITTDTKHYKKEITFGNKDYYLGKNFHNKIVIKNITIESDLNVIQTYKDIINIRYHKNTSKPRACIAQENSNIKSSDEKGTEFSQADDISCLIRRREGNSRVSKKVNFSAAQNENGTEMKEVVQEDNHQSLKELYSPQNIQKKQFENYEFAVFIIFLFILFVAIYFRFICSNLFWSDLEFQS